MGVVELSEPILLTVDMGTTNAKACLFGIDGPPRGIARREYVTQHRRATPDETIATAFELIEQVLDASQIDRAAVRGIAFSARNDAGRTVALDAADVPFDLQVDGAEVASLHLELQRQLFPEHIEELLGVLGITPLLQWLQTKGQAQYARLSKLMGVKDYAIYKICGAFVCDELDRGYLRTPVSFAQREGLLEPCEARLPTVVPPTSIVGHMSPEYAARFGLNADLPVCVGSRDGNCANVGCGTVEPGQACTTLASYGVIRAVWDAPLLDLPKNRISPRRHAVPGQWLLDSTPGGGALCLRWFRDTFGQVEVAAGAMTGADPYDLLDREAELCEPGAEGLLFLPYMTGMSAPERTRAAKGAFVGLTLDHTRRHVVRAILEGVTFAIRSGMEIIVASGGEVNELRATGGGARAPVWNQIQADVMNRPVLVSAVEEVECLGAAILLATGLGLYPSVRRAVAAMVRIKETYQPRPAQRARYNERYAVFNAACAGLIPVFTEWYAPRRGY
jgi:xylulokinase